MPVPTEKGWAFIYEGNRIMETDILRIINRSLS